MWYRMEDIDNPMKFYGIFIVLNAFSIVDRSQCEIDSKSGNGKGAVDGIILVEWFCISKIKLKNARILIAHTSFIKINKS